MIRKRQGGLAPWAIACWVALFSAAVSARDFDAVDTQSTRTSDGLALLVGEGDNIGVSSGSDSTFHIDDPDAPVHEKIVAAIQAPMLSDAKTRILPGYGPLSQRDELVGH